MRKGRNRGDPQQHVARATWSHRSAPSTPSTPFPLSASTADCQQSCNEKAASKAARESARPCPTPGRPVGPDRRARARVCVCVCARGATLSHRSAPSTSSTSPGSKPSGAGKKGSMHLPGGTRARCGKATRTGGFATETARALRMARAVSVSRLLLDASTRNGPALLAWTCVCLRASVRACVRACARACLSVRASACVRACVRGYERACVRVRARRTCGRRPQASR